MLRRFFTTLHAPRSRARGHSAAWRAGVLLLLAWLATGQASAGVRLRESCVVDPAASALTLGDVAQLEGPDALALSGHVLRARPFESDSAAWFEITIEDVSRSLTEAGVPTGRLAMSGRSCRVRPRVDRPALSAAAAAQEPASAQPPAGSIGAEVLERLAAHYGVQSSDLRATFEAADRAALARPLASETLIIQPVSSDASATAVVQVRRVKDGSILEARTVHAQVEVQRQVLVTRRMIAAKRSIGAEDLAPEQRWVAPATASPFASVQDAVGAFVRTRLEPGTVLRPDHVLSPLAVKRNELVTVYSVSDGFEIKVQARAKSDARVGEVIEFRTERSKSWFRARVDGPGVAVVVNDVDPSRGADAHSHAPAIDKPFDAVAPEPGAVEEAPGILITRSTRPTSGRTSERAP